MMGWMQSWGRVLSPFGGGAVGGSVGGSVRALVVKARDGSIRTAINAARLRVRCASPTPPSATCTRRVNRWMN
jgi:hypothetical protein